MTEAQKDYTRLHHISRHTRILSGISSLLDWDQETYMPHGATGIRSSQIEALAGIIHAEKTGKKFVGALSKLIDIPSGKVNTKGLTPPQTAALREWRRDYIKEKALPKKFVEEWAKTCSQSIIAWSDAKKADAFLRFAPFLDKIVAMSRKKADYLGYKDHPYDALLDQFEQGTFTKELTTLFSALRKSIVDLLKKISKVKQPDQSFLKGPFPIEKQLEFSHMLLQDMGYNKEFGRLDISTHPFSSASHPTDSRITTRIDPHSVVECFSAILHEGGHALYEMGLPQEHYGSPLGESISLGIHESQSRWWETRIGSHKSFWKYYFPKLQKHFGGGLQKASLDTFYRAINQVKPSLIRVGADEVTYGLHIILRFELERALIEGSMKVRDIPDAWNAKMKELLGIVPSSNAQGCLQDIHWSMGGFGYFPSYTLGNLYAAQLFVRFEKDHPDWEKRISKGDLLFIKDWLHNAVHKFGRQFTSRELLKKVTGKNFSADAYIAYLNEKYADIYKL